MNAVFLGLHTRNVGTQSHRVTNPFTGKAITVYRDHGMTSEEVKASSKVLMGGGASEPDPDGFRKVVFLGGNCAQIDLGPVAAEIHVEGGLTRDVAAFVFRLALASGMLVCSTIDPAVVAVLPGQHHLGIADRWPEAASVGSVDELMVWIEKEIAQGRIAG